jgi:hypothetical protein
MIPQHAVSKQIGHPQEMPLVQLQKEIVIPFFNEYILAIHAAIVNVIISVKE